MRRLLRLIGARTGISIGLIIVIVAVLTVARLIDDQRVPPPVRAPSGWTPDVAATEGDDGPIADPTPTYTDDEAVLAAATAFTTAWLNRTLPADAWLDGLRPHATEALIDRLTGVDPLDVPAGATAGEPTIRERAEQHAEVVVPIGAGDTLVLGLVLVDGRWLVGTLDRETG